MSNSFNTTVANWRCDSKLIYTNSERVNSVLKYLYIDTSGYGSPEDLSGLYLANFGYYQPNNWIYFQLRTPSLFIGFVSIENGNQFEGPIFATLYGIKIYVLANWKDFVENTPHQEDINLTPLAFIPSISSSLLLDSQVKTNNIDDLSITTNKLANESVDESKIKKYNITNDKIKNTTIDFKKLVSYFPLFNGENIIEDATIRSSYFWNYPSNSESGPYPNRWQYYILLNVLPGEYYKITTTAGIDARVWYQMNENNEVVAASTYNGSVSERTEIVYILPGVTKLFINSRIEDGDTPTTLFKANAKLSADDVFVDETNNIKQYVDRKVSSNILYGKTLVCCGDSITEGADIDAEGIVQQSDIKTYQSDNFGNFTEVTHDFKKTYGYQIAERNSMVFYNAGVSGSTMQGLVNKNGFSLQNGRYTKLPEIIDYLLIWFGWNDTAYGSLGTIEDVTNETFYGGYNVVMPYLINKYPYTKIALIVPFGTDVGHRNAIRALANKWGVACFDNYQGGTPLYYGKEENVEVDASIVTSNRTKYQANGAHPNYKGHRQLGDMIEHFLRSI